MACGKIADVNPDPRQGVSRAVGLSRSPSCAPAWNAVNSPYGVDVIDFDAVAWNSGAGYDAGEWSLRGLAIFSPFHLR